MRKLLAIASILALSSAPAFADPVEFPTEILNGQLNIANSINNINVDVHHVETTMDVSGIAAGNNLSAETWGNTSLVNDQSFGADAFSTVTIAADSVCCEVNVDNMAMANNAALTANDANSVQVVNSQGTFVPTPPPAMRPRPVDPTATTNINLGYTHSLNVNTVATANNFALKTNAPSIHFDSQQDNVALTQSFTNVVANTVGSMDIKGAAIGNNVSIGGIE